MADASVLRQMVKSKLVAPLNDSSDFTEEGLRQSMVIFDPSSQDHVQDKRACVAVIFVRRGHFEEDGFLEEDATHRFNFALIPSPDSGRDFPASAAKIGSLLELTYVVMGNQALDFNRDSTLDIRLWDVHRDHPKLHLEAQLASSIIRPESFPAFRLALHCNTGGSLQVIPVVGVGRLALSDHVACSCVGQYQIELSRLGIW